MYETLSSFAQTWGMFFMIVPFVVAVVYALWPGNRAKFSRAAAQPLQDEPPAAAEAGSAGQEKTR